MIAFARSLGLETNGQQLGGLKDQFAKHAAATVRIGLVNLAIQSRFSLKLTRDGFGRET